MVNKTPISPACFSRSSSDLLKLGKAVATDRASGYKGYTPIERDWLLNFTTENKAPKYDHFCGWKSFGQDIAEGSGKGKGFGGRRWWGWSKSPHNSSKFQFPLPETKVNEHRLMVQVGGSNAKTGIK